MVQTVKGFKHGKRIAHQRIILLAPSYHRIYTCQYDTVTDTSVGKSLYCNLLSYLKKNARICQNSVLGVHVSHISWERLLLSQKIHIQKQMRFDGSIILHKFFSSQLRF
ncbi:hypothetical protein AMTRI_Chr06g197550 [Amborella trichopoda]